MAGGGALQLLNGRITADGNIQCFCSRCQGHQKVPNSVFEEHAGSKVGLKPADCRLLLLSCGTACAAG